jgi:hypothetical protein
VRVPSSPRFALMSTISAGLVQTTNLTVTGTQAGAVQATNLNFNNLGVSGNMNVGGALSLPAHSNIDTALSAVETKLNTIQPLVRDPSLPTFEELEATQAQNYGNLYIKNIPTYTPHYDKKRISNKNRSVNICYPANTYKSVDMNYNEEVFKKTFAYFDKFFPNVKMYPTYAHHNIQGREPFIFDVTKDASDNVSSVANNDVILGAEWYACGFYYDIAGTNLNHWYMLFDFKYADTGASENFTGIPTHMRVITPLKNLSTVANIAPMANGRLFINTIPITTNPTLHAANVASNIDSVLWSDSVLSLKAKIYDNVQRPTAYTNIINTTTSKNVAINFDAVNFFRSPSFTNVYKAYSFTPEAFIQKGNATIQGWASGSRPDTFGDRDSSNNVYDGLVAMTYNVDSDLTIKFTNVVGKYIYNGYANSDDFTKVPDAKNNAPGYANSWVNTWLLPIILSVNVDGKIDMPSYSRASTLVTVHEFLHTLQLENLWHYKNDSEGQVTYLEHIPDINNMGDRFLYRQQNFARFPKNCTLNSKTFLGPLTNYQYEFSFFYLYMSKYDTVDSEFVRNPRFFKEVWNVIQNRTYLSNGSDSIWGIGHNSQGIVLTDASGELTQFEIYNKAYQALMSDSSANILASQHENIVMASMLYISQTEANTIYASVHPKISNWAFPDYLNIQAYKGLKIKELEEQGELKSMVRTIITQAMRDAPKLNTFSPEFVVQKNYDDLKLFAENTHITNTRKTGFLLTEVSSIPGTELNVVLEPYSAISINALQSSQTIISSKIVTVRTVYFPADNNLTINDISPVITVDGSSNNIYTYTVTTDSSNTIIAVINSTSNTPTIRGPGLLPLQRLILGTTFFAPADIEYGVITTFSGGTAPIDAYANITSPLVIVGKPTTNLADMIGPNGMKVGVYADFFDANGVSVVTNKIAICRRGVTGFGLKANNAWHAGAKGLIIIDNTESTTDLGMSALTTDTAMDIPVWRIRPSWYHANIAPYLVASSDNRYATTSYTANWALNYQYGIPVNPAGVPPSFRDSSEHDYTIAEVIVDPDVEDM